MRNQLEITSAENLISILVPFSNTRFDY